MPTWMNRQKLKSWMKWIVLLGFVVMIPRLASLRDVGQKLREANLALVGVALVMNLVSLWLQSARWRVLLVRSSISTQRLFAMNLVGVASGFLLPAAAAGDLVKSTILARTEGFADALLSTAIGRLVGMIAVGLTCLLGLLLWTSHGTLVEPWEVAVFVLCAIAGILSLYRGGRIGRILLAHFPAVAAKRWISKPVEYLELLGDDPKRLTKALLLSLAQQGALIVSGWSLFHAAGSDIPPGPVLALLPLIQLGTLVPISAGGVGMREGLTLGLFCGLIGMSRDICLASIALGYMVLVVQVLLGGLAWIVVFREPSPK